MHKKGKLIAKKRQKKKLWWSGNAHCLVCQGYNGVVATVWSARGARYNGVVATVWSARGAGYNSTVATLWSARDAGYNGSSLAFSNQG